MKVISANINNGIIFIIIIKIYKIKNPHYSPLIYKNPSFDMGGVAKLCQVSSVFG